MCVCVGGGGGGGHDNHTVAAGADMNSWGEDLIKHGIISYCSNTSRLN